MPKNAKKGKKGAKAAIVKTADDFDDMLAEVMANDPRPASVSITTASTSATTSSTSSAGAEQREPRGPQQSSAAPKISDERIINACMEGDTAQLLKWGLEGVRVGSGVPLCIACAKGLSRNVLRCLVKDLGSDANQSDSEGNTALMAAAHAGYVDALLCLVEEFSADVHQRRSSDGRTALMAAAHGGSVDALTCLVELGADVKETISDGSTALMEAAYAASVDVVQCLVKEFGASVNQPRSNDGITALIAAARDGDLDMVRCLLKLKADVNKTSDDGATALMAASFHKHHEIVVWLVKAGADTQVVMSAPSDGYAFTAAVFSRDVGASIEQTAYLEAKTHCSKFCCSGAGIMKCTACKQVRYCREQCQLAHWKVHKVDCKRWRAELKADKGKPN
jgi:ankyrin repeat protein